MGEEAIHGGHRDRLRLRALAARLEGIPSHEVLELILTYTIPWRDVNDLAHRLIDRFGSLAGALHADRDTLAGVSGMGEKTADFLLLMGRALDEYARDDGDGQPSYTRAVQMTGALRALGLRPGYYLACLNTRAQLRMVTPLSRGDDPRALAGEMIEAAVRNRAYIVALVRQGGEDFTETDQAVLPAFARAGKGLEIMCLDLLVLCDSGGDHSLRAIQARRDTEDSHGGQPLGTPDWEETFPHWLENWKEQDHN